MSSFKKRTTTLPIPGTRPSSSSSLSLISTGLPTIDDLLGGGLPLSTSLLITQDYPTSYSELLSRYFIAQGLESNQECLIISNSFDQSGGPQGITRLLMGTDQGITSTGGKKEDREDEEEKKLEQELKEKMKIAFRYEGMKLHQTTLQSTTTSSSKGDTYCSTFDLTTTRTLSSQDHENLHYIDVSTLPTCDPYSSLISQITSFLTSHHYLSSPPSSPSSPRRALRLIISSLGSPSYPPSSPTSLYSFLHSLRSLLRHSNCSALITFPSYLYAPSFLSRISHISDSVLSLTSTSSSPSLSSLYPRHQGLLTLPKLPTPSSLLPPSAKLSLLRNLGGGGEGRENLLGFRVKRRRFVVEVVGDEPELGEEEVEKKQRERRKRVEEANRRDRESGGKATDVLLGEKGKGKGKAKSVGFGQEEVEEQGEVEIEKGMGEIRIGAEEEESKAIQETDSNAPVSAFKKKKKGVRMGGVSFKGDEEEEEPPKEKKKVSISAMLHQQPELLDF
ncbi:hypothetical protein JCM5353_006462 [Sporobolomyces roseus]